MPKQDVRYMTQRHQVLLPAIGKPQAKTVIVLGILSTPATRGQSAACILPLLTTLEEVISVAFTA